MTPSALCPSLYNEYVAGTLDEGLALILAAYLAQDEYCAVARAQARACERVAGALLDHMCAPVDMKDGSLQNVLARLDEDCAAACADVAPVTLRDGVTLPAPLAAFMAGRPLRWRGVGGGSRMAVLPAPSCGTHIMVLDIAPGRAMPAHRHDGIELTLVLRGAYHDTDDYFTAGQISCHAPGTSHRPVADAQDGCICISAVSGMVFAGFFPRLFSRFLMTR